VARLPRPEAVLAWLGGISMLLLALLTPPFMVPDEQQHFFRAFQVSELKILQESEGLSGGYIPRSLPNAAAAFIGSSELHPVKVRASFPIEATLAELERPLNPNDRVFVPFFTGYFPTGYLPQVLGIWVGRAMGLGPVGLLYASRIGNVAVALLIILLAVRMMPSGATAALVVAMLPSTQMEIASASPDAITLGTAILLGAFAVRAALGRSSFVGLFGAACAVCLAKLAYLPLAFAGVIAPKNQMRLRHFGLGAVVLLVAAVWLKATPTTFEDVRPGTDFTAQLQFVFAHPLSFMVTMLATLVINTRTLLEQAVGIFGWLGVPLPQWLYVLYPVVFAASLIAPSEKAPVGLAPLAWWLLLSAGAVVLVSLAIYLHWTPVGAPLIEGLQGRYFTPILPLVGCAIAARLSLVDLGRARTIAYAIVLSALLLGTVAMHVVVIRGFHVFS
jgi:uncharacterized membrane protein